MRKNYKGLPKKSNEAGPYKPLNVKLFDIYWFVFLFKMKMLHLLKCCTDYHETSNLQIFWIEFLRNPFADQKKQKFLQNQRNKKICRN